MTAYELGDLIAIFILHIFLFIAVPLWICSILYIITNGKLFKFFYHDLLGWHLVTTEDYINNTTFDGCNEHNHCSLCGKEVMQDSQGNWF